MKSAAATRTSSTPSSPTPAVAQAPKRKLSFKEQRELDALPGRLEQLEAEIASRTQAMNDPKFFQQDSAAIVRANEEIARLQAELDAAFARWEALEAGA
jgi:ATP-binding cassette subfamily F protein uup